MSILLYVSVAVASISLVSWLYLLLARGFFWRIDVYLDASGPGGGFPGPWPPVAAIVPARNEAAVLPDTLPALLAQDYPGELRVFLVDDRSSDGTGTAAEDLALSHVSGKPVTIVRGEALPDGWAGKVWAMHQGVRAAEAWEPEYFWFSDADIAPGPYVLQGLVSKAATSESELVSLIAQLHCRGIWEQFLVPAFVYFFTKLFPFRWVNDVGNRTAAAAGGCLLVRRQTLAGRGGLAAVAGAIIDDCALARLIKNAGDGTTRIWLGLGRDVRSVRAYDGLPEVWRMVARTAYTQLRYSIVRLAATIIAMLVIYGVPVAAVLGGALALGLTGDDRWYWLLAAGLGASTLASTTYLPMLRWYDTPPSFGLLLPLAGLVYTLMTIDSARRHWSGKGGAWKGRTYGPTKKSGLEKGA